MYCPTCGIELTQELSYCNRCGANLKPLVTQVGVPPTKLVGAAWAISVAIAVVTLGGFGMIFAVVMSLITSGMNLSGGGMVLILFFLLIILAIAWLLTRQLARVLDLPLLSGSVAQQTKSTLTETPVQQISAPREPVSSVTENTTRMFEPTLRDRDTKR
jgi:hypothetical protein